MKRTALLLAAWLIGCGEMAQTERAVGCGWSPDADLHGAHLDNESENPFTKEPNFRPRLRKTIEGAADYWGHSYNSLHGWKIRLIDGAVNCYGSHKSGCTDWLTMTITLDIRHKANIEGSALVHEFGHVILPFGDKWHDDHRWDDREVMADTYKRLMLPCIIQDAETYSQRGRWMPPTGMGLGVTSRVPPPDFEPAGITTTDERYDTLAPCQDGEPRYVGQW